MLTRVRNAIAVSKNEVSMPHSKIKETVARILAQHNFLSDVNVSEENGRKVLNVIINAESESPRITEISRLSRSGKRTYVKADEIPVIKRGRGIVVISTSQGVMEGKRARSQRLGGELICKVY